MNEDLPIHVIELADLYLKNTYFSFNNKLHRQTEGGPMGSASSDICNLLMGYFETKALNGAVLTPKLWLRYKDAIFIIWFQRQQELNNFANYLNSIHNKIQSITEIEKNNKLFFLDV